MLTNRRDESVAHATNGPGEGFEAGLAETPLWTALLFFAGAVAASGVLRSSGLRADVERLVESALACGALGAWALAIARRQGYRGVDLLGPAPDRAAVWVAFGVAVTNGVFSQFILRLSYRFSWRLGASDYVDAAAKGPLSAWDALYWILLPVLVGPLVEELVFRGILFRKWRRTLGPVTGLVLSSAVFGALHYEPE